MISVCQAYPGETLDCMVDRFIAKCRRENLMQDIRRSMAYKKPSEKKRITANKARTRGKKY